MQLLSNIVQILGNILYHRFQALLVKKQEKKEKQPKSFTLFNLGSDRKIQLPMC